MVRRFMPRDFSYAKFSPGKTPIAGPPYIGFIPREFLKRFSPENTGRQGAPCDEELMAVMEVMWQDPNKEVSGPALALVDALHRCLDAREGRGPKSSLAYHMFKVVRPRK